MGAQSRNNKSVLNPLARLSAEDLSTVVNALDVEVLALAECVVGPGYALDLGGALAAGIHYCLSGSGRLIIGDRVGIDLTPHTLVVVPPVETFRIENGATSRLIVVDGNLQKSRVVERGTVQRISAGDGDDRLLLICGFFRAAFASTVELFGTAFAPIVERFEAADRLDTKIKEALDELVAQEVGSGAMSSALLKIVIITLLRRELSSTHEWVEHFALFKDTSIMRAFADMAARPGDSHSVETLAKTAYLSKSTFMKRFSSVFGRPPMEVLRELRMRRAAVQLKANMSSVDNIARDAGYKSRSSFTRAFIKTFGCDWAAKQHDPNRS